MTLAVSGDMTTLWLTPAEVEEIMRLLDSLRATYGSAEEPDFLFEAPVFARTLPTRVHRYLNRFRREEPGCVVISGHPVDDAVVGPTPGHWNQRSVPSATVDQDMLLVLYGALLGDVFGWATQQNGSAFEEGLAP